VIASRSTSELVALERYVERHPVGTVVAAFGVGYLLSGALFSKATARILGLGLRYASPSMLNAAFGEQALFNLGKAKSHNRPKESA
jgi:hypothetical protein